MEETLYLYKNVLWRHKNSKEATAYCPEHRNELDVMSEFNEVSQSEALKWDDQIYFVCPVDEKKFDIPSSDLHKMIRRFIAARMAENFKDANIVSIDGYQVPIAKGEPVSKDSDYWVQCRINDTKKGKQLVVYAGERGASDKTQIFLDIENDKISFDQNNIHPNDVFCRLVADFQSGKKATLESKK